MGKKLRRPVIEAVLLAVVAGVILSAGWVLARTYDTQRAYTPTNLIRLHIIGNSDDLQDQEVKLKIRDVLLSTFGERLLNVTDRQEAEAILTVLLPEIEDTARDCLVNAGFCYGVSAKITNGLFPDKYYETASGESFFLPEGSYKALQVVLGAGKGRNWWCVMYPPLCYVDIVRGNIIYGDLEKEAKTDKGDYVLSLDFKGLIDEDSLQEAPVEVRFLIVDILKKGKDLLPTFLASLASKFTHNLPPGTEQQ